MDPMKRRPEDRTLAPRIGKAAMAIQRWVVKRAWALIVLFLVSEGAAILAGEIWGPEYRVTGRLVAHISLLLLGLFAFWIWPRKAKFMKRLVVLLLVFGAALAAPGLIHAASVNEWSMRSTWDARHDYMLTDLGLRWIYSGLGLALVMGIGLVVRQRMVAKRRAAGTIKPVKAAARSQPVAVIPKAVALTPTTSGDTPSTVAAPRDPSAPVLPPTVSPPNP